ncbi:MAG: cobalamin biosynthesis protein CobD [Gammaproteobacteria bacterium]|jgi:adenosylcobinamide-phosphate synthase|nr:cobalamin biosynthesis protein CobD [Gammaproteobacteria bacterium]MBT4491780.1 cobalamin biosynthesis protein CobD [Gammaproteobacteria bacterium]MBT7372205.1 cobalamin biosynthesis protein CobD [Gammaproteobacteria bacterium]
MLGPFQTDWLFGVLLLAFLLELKFGWPASVNNVIGHPVSWLGRVISALEVKWNREDLSPTSKQLRGGLLVLVISGIALIPVTTLLGAIGQTWGQTILAAVFSVLVAASLFATRSLRDHVSSVVSCLAEENLPGARKELAKIVSRETADLDRSEICSGAIESLSENASDAVVAPMFWALVFGVPGLLFYKAVNTMDSMLGYRSARYEHFGKAAARLDDVVNWIPARLAGFGLALMGGENALAGIKVMLREAGGHRSPNAGWPEAAVAGVLAVRLGGPRIYPDQLVESHYLNGHTEPPCIASCFQAIKLYDRLTACILITLTLAVVASVQGMLQ